VQNIHPLLRLWIRSGQILPLSTFYLILFVHTLCRNLICAICKSSTFKFLIQPWTPFFFSITCHLWGFQSCVLLQNVRVNCKFVTSCVVHTLCKVYFLCNILLVFFFFYIHCSVHHCNCLKNNQHDVTCGLSFIFMGSHSFSTCFELSGSSKHVENEW